MLQFFLNSQMNKVATSPRKKLYMLLIISKTSTKISRRSRYNSGKNVKVSNALLAKLNEFELCYNLSPKPTKTQLSKLMLSFFEIVN